MIAAPKVTQAIFAALGDYYTWKLGERVYGQGTNEAWATVRLFLPQHAFCWVIHSGRLVASADYLPARSHCMQSLAVVLFDPHFLKLPRNDPDNRRSQFLAMAMVYCSGRRGGN